MFTESDFHLLNRLVRDNADLDSTTHGHYRTDLIAYSNSLDAAIGEPPASAAGSSSSTPSRWR